MHLVTATLRIYRQAAADAGRAFTHDTWAFRLLLLAWPLLNLVSTLSAPLGFAGGFLYSIVQAAVVGTYLATLQDALTLRRPMNLATVRGNLGRYTWEVIGVLFPLFLLELLLSVMRTPSGLMLAVSVILGVALNPVPEMIGRTRSRGTDLLQDALTFMYRNGVEWLLPQALVLGGLALAWPSLALPLVALFGPRFGFIHAGGLALAGGVSPAGIALGLAILVGVHLVMLFRGALYVRLGDGGRRARAWRARFEP